MLQNTRFWYTQHHPTLGKAKSGSLANLWSRWRGVSIRIICHVQRPNFTCIPPICTAQKKPESTPILTGGLHGVRAAKAANKLAAHRLPVALDQPEVMFAAEFPCAATALRLLLFCEMVYTGHQVTVSAPSACTKLFLVIRTTYCSKLSELVKTVGIQGQNFMYLVWLTWTNQVFV